MADTYLRIPRAVYVRQTPKAVRFRVGKDEQWVPRSHIRARIHDWRDYDGEIEITTWIAQQKNWEHLGEDAIAEPDGPPPESLTITSDDMPNATKLYRELMRNYHPDKGGSEAVARDINRLWQEVFRDLRGNSKKPR